MDIIKSQMKERMTTKRLTNLQKRNRLERNRQKALAQKIRKYPALCISRKFIEYAYLQRWDKEVIDAAAWVMHRYFMRCRKPNVRGWVQIPYQEFESMFGKNYTKMLYHLLSIGFLEENVKWKYAVGHHYYHYRLCKELRFDKISAKYYLQTRAYQVRFIEIKKRDIRDKKRHDCMPEQERHALVTDKMDDAFITITNSKSKHVKQDYVTPEQYGTIRTLATNANLLKIQIDDETLMDIAEKRHAQRKNPKCTLDAYVQWIQNKVNKAYIPNLRIDRYGRYYTPLTNIPREIWDYTSYRGQQLSSVDVKTSHAIVLLVLLKDIGMNYFRTDGTHEERLKQCEFSRQILMIPGLARYLHTVSVAFDELEGRCKPFTDLIPDFGNELTHATYKQFQEHLQENKQIKPYNYNDYLQIVRIFGNSISNNASTMEFLNPDAIHNYQPILPTQSILYFTRQNVGFWIQVEQYKQVKENFQDCRRILESMWESVNFTASPPCLTDFRNLFFPSQREIDQFEKTLADDIYSLLMKEIGTDLTRDYFKTEFFHFLYRPAFSYYIGKRDSKDGATEEPIRKSMQGLFPSIVFFLDLCKCQPGTLNRKGIWYKWVPRAMLSIESQIMLECCTNLLKEYPNMFLTTLHDCIKCLPKDVEKVQEELERTFAKYHVSPKFEKQEHKRKSNLNS